MNVAQFIFVAVFFFIALPLAAIWTAWRPYLLAQKLRERGLRTQGTRGRVEHTVRRCAAATSTPRRGLAPFPRKGAPSKSSTCRTTPAGTRSMA
ncbi:hypothetical protein D7Y04_26395 [Corallococcus sp. AB038B]|nr:hypothetical protein D7Y04_26395 [Corallococcus sp. AB038B]